MYNSYVYMCVFSCVYFTNIKLNRTAALLSKSNYQIAKEYKVIPSKVKKLIIIRILIYKQKNVQKVITLKWV